MIVKNLQRFFAPLTLALENRTAAMVLIRDLGWTLDEGFELDAFAVLAPVSTRLQELLTVIEAYDPDDPDAGAIVEQAVLMAGDVQTTIEDLKTLSGGDVAGLVSPLNTADFWEELALDLPEYLILTYLRLYVPPLHALVYFGGAIVMEPRPDGRPERETLDWQALARLFSDPDGQIRDFYDWGGTLDHQLLVARLGHVLRALGLPARRTALPQAITADRYPQGGGEAVQALALPMLDPVKQRIPWDGSAGDAGAAISSALDLMLAPVPQGAAGTAPDGVLLTLQAVGRASFSVDLGKGWLLSSTAMIDPSGVLGLELQPSGLSLSSGSPAGSIDLALSATTPADEPMILFGEPGKTRLEMSSLSASFGLTASTGSPDMRAGVGLDGMQVVLCAGDGDGFLSDILDGAEVVLPIEFVLDWSSADGVKINGGAGFEIEFLVDKQLGPAHLQIVGIGAALSGDGASFWATTSGSLTIGPFGAVVAGIGLEAVLTPHPRGQGGLNGAVSVKLGFKPPNEIGLFLDAPGMGGGGYLANNAEAGEYAGILDITLFGFKVTAIGMIATRLPSGEDGWSLFLSISIIFPTGIPLVFGFSWTGVGGLIGVNRGIDIEVLGDGVRSGSLDAVLFPQNAIANAPMILSALDTFFPAQRGQYAFGPIFQISWGAKGLITIQLGLAIQLPSPLTISLLGSLQIWVGLPDKDAPPPLPPDTKKPPKDVILIRVDVAGTLWPTEGKLAIDAAITEGFIVGMNLSGDMAVRMEFQGKPNVVVAMGGFHPQFTAPEGFPALNRLSFKIFDKPNLRIGVENYLAISSNAFHFGVAAFFFAEAIGFVAEGRFEFDTIINFRPFGMVATLSFQVSVSAGSVYLLQILLRGTLKGPKPWIVTGQAEFKVLGVKKQFRVEMTLGSAVSEGPDEVVALFDAVRDALGEAAAWSSEESDVALLEAVQFAAPSGQVLFHPALRVQVTQGVAPLGIALEKFGEMRIADDQDSLSIDQVGLGGRTALSEPVQEWFAPAQFFDMTDDEKINAPSFEPLESGRSIGPTGPQFAPADMFEMSHENIIIDPDVEEKWPRPADQPAEDKPLMGQFAPTLDAVFLKSGSGLDLKPSTAPVFTVSEPDLVAIDPARPDVAISGLSFTKALSNKRLAEATGQFRVIQSVYERNLEEV